jgi:predicted TIM-barrel fold metal-dependent hydrolase
MNLADQQVIDVDSHVTEVADLWTARVASKWGEAIPQVRFDENIGLERWYVGGKPLTPVGYFANTGYDYPGYPQNLTEADKGTWDPSARLAWMDDQGIWGQVLYPNVIGFNSATFATLDPELSVECVRAYNDYMIEFAQTDAARLYPIAMLPFWDVDACVKEIERAASIGSKGVLFAAHWDRLNLPVLTDPHWNPVFEVAQATNMSLNTHIGFQSGEIEYRPNPNADRMPMVGNSINILMSNASALAKFIDAGVCHRYPELKIVSVESGFNYLPWVLDCLDWHFQNLNIRSQYKDRLLPSEYFKRQMYATFWFEGINSESIEEYQDNVMFETDYPHATSLAANLVSTKPLDFVEDGVGKLRPEIQKKLLHDNAARVYKLV